MNQSLHPALAEGAKPYTETGHRPLLYLLAKGYASVRAEELADLRTLVKRSYAGKLTNAVFKHVDDQSVVALEALRQAGAYPPPRDSAWGNWGVVASPCLPGRSLMADCIQRFQSEGAWAVSPHIIPHCSLHSLAGLVSLALDCHGINLGIGGMPGDHRQVLLVAPALLCNGHLEGIWVILSGADHVNGKVRAVAFAVSQVPTTSSTPIAWSDDIFSLD
ncbi:MAG: hypothetical protein KatS3mg105_1387 [Gemmatales bacterium]|nr:MAG: hypothetical protein KatS3mg105_1387 [Gemmatales bacterium]